MAGIKIKIDPVDKILLKRNLNQNGQAQKFFSSEVRRMSDPYVPFLKGPLKNTARVYPNRIEYIQPYARKNYYENKGYGTQGTSKGGLRGKQWVPRMWIDKGKTIVRSVAKFAGGVAK